MAFSKVPLYSDLLDRRRENKSVEGFDFDVNTFENLIDSFVPMNKIPVILGVSHGRLDDFCQIVYGMKFSEAYNLLSAISDMWGRRVIENLSTSGNATALSILAKHFMGLDDEKKESVQVTIVNDLNKEDGNV